MNKYIIKVNGTSYEVEVQEVGGTRPAAPMAARGKAPAIAQPVVKTSQPQKTAAPGGAGDVCAPMPGTVLKVKVAAGDTVTKGQVLLILEAMKMENEIVSPADGKVASLNVEAGKSVTAGEVMVTIA